MRMCALLLCLFTGLAHAQEARVVSEVVRRSGYERELVERYWQTGCAEAGSNAENICVLYGFVAGDMKLTDTYRSLLATLKDSEAKTKLRAAQRAWLNYRDLSCKFEVHGESGLYAAMITNGCMASRTTARLKELQAYLEGR